MIIIVNQRDVAKLAGVSSATVSRYINNASFINDNLREKIAKAIKELNYRPNLIARSLKMCSSKTIGLIFPDIENAFFISLIKKAEGTAFNAGYNVILCNTENDLEKEKVYIDVLKGKLIDGFIIITSFKDKTYLEDVLKDEVAVYLDRSIGIMGETVIKLDNTKGIKLVVEYLVSLGHRKIGIINVSTDITPSYERYEGYKQALKDADIKLDMDLVKFSGVSVEGSYIKVKELLTQKNKPTALVSISNRVTIGALKAIKDLNIKTPGDLSMVGFDDFKTAELLTPRLTVLAQPVYEFGEVGVKTLINKIGGMNLDGKTINLEPELIIRESCRKI